jgi:flagellar protein FlaJ
MKSSNYTLFCLKVFNKLVSKFNKEEDLEVKNVTLVKADIPLSYEEYYSTAIMNTILGFIISIIIIQGFFTLFPSELYIFFIVLVPLLIIIIITLTYYYYPFVRTTQRGRNIDLFLPYAINFVSSMAVAGISPAEIFETLSKISVYGEVQIEAKKITKEIKVMGTDNITALKHAIEVSPSRKFKAFLQGIIGCIQSGSDLHIYFANIASKFMEDDLTDRKRDLDVLTVIAEVMVLAVIAFPIFLVIVLTVMGFFGGSMSVSLAILLIFSFIGLPIIYACFYLLIKFTSIEQLRYLKTEKKTNIKEFYKENKITILLLFVATAVIILSYIMINLFEFLEYISLDLYNYWDFIFLAIIILIAPVGFYNYLKLKTKKEMQQRLPDFLVEIGDSLSTGMNIFESIKAAEKGHYGKLSPEIKKMKTQLSWNISMKNVLFDFANRMKSAIVQRIIIVIDKGLMMGGNTPRIFKAAAKEVDQVNQVENQRRSIMSIYALVIVICFFVFLAIVIILNATIYKDYIEIQAKQAISGRSPIKLSTVDPLLLEYTLYSFVFVQSLGAGILAGFMMDGKISSGVRYSVILGIISMIVFIFLL